MKIGILGATGMLGNMMVEQFADKTNYKIIATARNKNLFKQYKNVEWKLLDAETAQPEDIEKLIADCDYVINCIGVIKPYIQDDNAQLVEKSLLINALFPHKLAKAAEKNKVKVLQIATDCVYDGTAGHYREDAEHDALDVYGKTKSLGEVYSDNVMNLRCSIIGHELKSKKSLLEWFLEHGKNSVVNGYKNHLWNGITTYHFTMICLGIIKENLKFVHLQHVIPTGFLSKFQMLEDFADVYNRNDIKINPINASISINRTLSTSFTDFNKTLWKSAGYSTIPTVSEMITELCNYSKNKN